MRKALSDVYVETDRTTPRPFPALPEEEWNDAVNNYRQPLGPYDYRRMLFVRDHLYTDGAFEEAFTFTIVRNPYARAVSSWKFCYRDRLKWRALHAVSQRLCFRQFLRSLPEVWETKSNRHTATHTRPVWPDLTDDSGCLLVDFVARLERIDDDFPVICEELGIEPRRFPHVNTNRRERHYSEFYTPASRRLVEEYYGDDIENFGYDFMKPG